MKNNTDLKNLFKIFVIGFIVISSIYVLYFYNNTNTNDTLENFANCSKCKIAPSNSSKCKPLYNINYIWDSEKKMVNVSNQLTDYVFCEWEPNCDYNATANNYLTQEQRIGLSNSQLQTYYNNSLR
jgi:hypothetical protein